MARLQLVVDALRVGLALAGDLLERGATPPGRHAEHRGGGLEARRGPEPRRGQSATRPLDRSHVEVRVQPLAKRDAVDPGRELTRLRKLGERDLDLVRQSAADVATGGIPGATVSTASARIGDGRSCYEDGVISHVNAAAARLKLEPGMATRALIERLLARHSQPLA